MRRVGLGRIAAIAAASTFMLTGAAALAPAVANAATTITVCASGCDYTDIQDAINGATTGDTVLIGSGVYQQTIDVDKSVTLEGDGSGNTIIEADPATINAAPAFTATGDGTSQYAIVNANAPSVTIEDLTVDGLDLGSEVTEQFDGIAEYDDSLTVKDVHVIGVSDSPPNGDQTGDGIYAVNDSATQNTVTVTDSAVFDYQKNGIAVDGNANVSVNISDDTIVADGPAGIGDNGIEIYDLWWEATPPAGPSGSISGNTVSGDVCTASGGVCGPDLLGDGHVAGDDDIGGDAAGMLLGNVSDLTVAGNTVSDSDIGVWATTASGASTTVSGNTLEDNLYADVLAGYGATTIDGNTIAGGADSVASLAGVLVAGYSDDPAGANASIAANTISGTDAGIEVAEGETPGAPAPSASITGNAISGNTQGIENKTSVAVSAPDNWYGCNGGPGATGCDTVTGAGASDVTSTPYLVLDLSGTPSTITPGSTSEVVASIRQDSAGTSFPAGSFPSGIEVAFTTSAGLIDATRTLVDGQAVTVLHGTPLGTATLGATLDNQTAHASVVTANPSSGSGPSTTSVTSTPSIAPLLAFLQLGQLSLGSKYPGAELAVTCIDGCSTTVSGTIALTEKQHHKTRHATLTLTTQQFTVAAGGSEIYNLALSASQRKSLKRASSATLTLQAAVIDAITGKTVTSSKSYALSRS